VCKRLNGHGIIYASRLTGEFASNFLKLI
jgi:hypothetical protein